MREFTPRTKPLLASGFRRPANLLGLKIAYLSGGPGGVTYIRACWLADRLSPALWQAVMVENRAGASGNLGTVAAVSAASRTATRC